MAIVRCRYEEECIAAVLLVKRSDGKILTVSRGRDLTDWGNPGGKIDEGETPAEAAIRETWEETGLHFAPEDLSDECFIGWCGEDKGTA